VFGTDYGSASNCAHTCAHACAYNAYLSSRGGAVAW
jgi:hypothetical protein